MSRRPKPVMVLAAALAPLALWSISTRARPAANQPQVVRGATTRDGHARPRALAFNPDDGLLYVALSTADEVAVVAPSSPPRVVATVGACRFPDALVALPDGGALVACRFDPGLRRISRGKDGSFEVATVAPELLAGARGLALARDGKLAYVASPALRGIAVVSLAGGQVIQTLATGVSPRTLRVVPAGAWPGHAAPLLVATAFIDHTVTVHPIGADGLLGASIQTIRTEAPVLDLSVTGGQRPALWLLTHEDRPVSRARGRPADLHA
ncbi:MAG TPA: hypothetical protein VKO16_06285 [Polyangia bacterium]|nr:hypothetical protein [Polyangia bacterium]